MRNYIVTTRRGENSEVPEPEELACSAHATSFAKTLECMLREAGHIAQSIRTTANMAFADAHAVPHILLQVDAVVPRLDELAFQSYARRARDAYPSIYSLGGADIRLDASLGEI